MIDKATAHTYMEQFHAACQGLGALDVGSGQLRTDVPAHLAAIVTTSGSTGTPQQVALSADAIRASVRATATRLGGHGTWLLALPVSYVAGFMILARSLAADTIPTVIGPGQFTPELFMTAANALDCAHPNRRYVSLVPTQLHRILLSPAATDLARSFDAVLVGGAALNPALAQRCDEAGLRIVRTYGMAETCGGCVYDGFPLAGVKVRLAAGHLAVAGPMLATGYLQGNEISTTAFNPDASGDCWFTTRDLGTISAGKVTVIGRADHVLNIGGNKIAAETIAGAISHCGGVAEVAVVGASDAQWGQIPVAFVVATSADAEILSACARQLPRHAQVRHIVRMRHLPRLASGKVDYRALTQLTKEMHGYGS